MWIIFLYLNNCSPIVVMNQITVAIFQTFLLAKMTLFQNEE